MATIALFPTEWILLILANILTCRILSMCSESLHSRLIFPDCLGTTHRENFTACPRRSTEVVW